MCVHEHERCRCVKQGDSDSDRLAGHVWAAVMDARGAVISKASQGFHDRAWQPCASVSFGFRVCVCCNCIFPKD